MQLTPHQVIALWEAMVDQNGPAPGMDKSPEVRCLLKSFDMPYICGDALRAQLTSGNRTDLAKLKRFFQACADAIPAVTP